MLSTGDDTPAKRVWRRVRRAWITAGLVATAVFALWSLLAYRSTTEARHALVADDRVQIDEAGEHWTFRPRTNAYTTGLLFFAGALVDPAAYAPLARSVAEAGYPVVLVRLPWRGAFGGAEGAHVLNRGVGATLAAPEVTRWVIAGHSRGGKVAAVLAQTNAPSFAALILIGTSHPRDFSLASSRLPVTRIYGTRDTIADVDKVERARINLPPTTRDVRIDGGNHSQFGYYGFQPGDWPATISRDLQQQLTRQAVLEVLRATDTAR